MLQKRLDYGFNGYHVPFVPRAARSARRRGMIQKEVEDNQLCAFDLLATVAGEILLEGEKSHNEDEKSNQLMVVENCELGSIEAASPPLTLEPGISCLGQDLNVNTPTSVFPVSDCVEKNVTLPKIDLNGELCGNSGEIEGLSHVLMDSCVPSSHNIDSELIDGKSPALVSSDGSLKLTLGRDTDHHPCRDDNVKVVCRDDDENSSECIQPSSMKIIRSSGDRRIRKLFTSKYSSKYWKRTSKARDGDLSDTEGLYRSRRTGYKRMRSQRIYPFKRRRFNHYTSPSYSHANIVAGQRTTFPTRESHVNLRIKAFRVPELFIEMPETATIGSLKRTVMEAVTALLGGGLRVGVLLQGKKIRDDNRTLLQSGISRDKKAASVGFSLEPNPVQLDPPVSSEENSHFLPTGVPLPQPLSRFPVTTSLQHGSSQVSADHMVNTGNFIESEHDSAPSPEEKATFEPCALVALPNVTPQPLSISHSQHKKSNRSDMSHRRIRRPFSVTEVEALVEAVEKLGTGRWRDVKLRAFENVNYRTYVDLKDKWKTLVHTARIAPQQRRGEPVPQILLHRVLAAHAFWTQVAQHQSKQELKQPPPETHFLL